MAKRHSRLLLSIPNHNNKHNSAFEIDLTRIQHALVNYENNVKAYHSVAIEEQADDERDDKTFSYPTLEDRARKQVLTITSRSSTQTDTAPAADCEEDDSEVWADAFEYQEKVLNGPRLTPERPPIEPISAKDQWSKAGETITEPDSALINARNDHYARFERQYPDVDVPPRIDPLAIEPFFEFHNYPTPTGRPPQVIYVTNENQFNGVIGLLKGPIFSVDLEWVVRRQLNISLIQISDANTVLLIQIFRFPRFPPKLRAIIEDPNIIKCGVAIMGADMSKLRDIYGVWARGVCELSAFARLIDRQDHGPKNQLISLSKLAHHYLGAPLRKGPVRASNWNQIPLSAEQREYAAIDAYAGYLIFMELERRRQARPEYKNIWPVVNACPSRSEKPAPLQPLSNSKFNALPRFNDGLSAEEEAQVFVEARKLNRIRAIVDRPSLRGSGNRSF